MIHIPHSFDMPNVIEEEEKVLIQLDSEVSRKGQHLLSLRAYQIVDFSSQYGSEDSVSYTADNFLGAPAVYPRVGDHAYSFQLRTYGQWWINVPSYPKESVIYPVGFVESQDFIEFRVERRIVPILLRIYEVYNPGAIVRILSYCYDTERWVILWQGEPELVNPKLSRCFAVTFEGVNFLTDYYRVEFHHQHLKYFCEFDGLILYGEDRFPLYFPSYNLPKSHFPQFPSKFVEPCGSPVKSHDDNLPIVNSSSYFDLLPHEVLLNIMSYLDLQSLCCVSSVSRLFKKICYDPILYRSLNLKLYWHLVNISTLKNLLPRLEALKSLNLSWCGGQGRISPPYFNGFLENKFEFLSILKVSCCSFINNSCMKVIVNCCQNIEVLEMKCCRAKDLTQTGFVHISLLPKLTYLDLYRTFIDTSTIITIIRNCSRIKHLFLGSCTNIGSYDEVAKEISENLKYIETVDFWRGISLTCVGVHALAKHCHNLVELDLGWCFKVDASCGCLSTLCASNRKLKKVYLSAIRTISNNDVNTIALYCEDLEQLDILGTSEIKLETCEKLLHSCKHLRLLDVSYCDSSVKQALPFLQENYPSVEIKCSVPSDIN